MLHSLSIQHFTIIDSLVLEFNAGMTVLTGETGAGKSILIDALMLALGGRSDSNCIRKPEERCTISAGFNIHALTAIKEWLSERELISDDNECVLRRVLTRDGRSRAFINDQAVSLQQLRELGQLLISIHGQHEHQTLLKAEKQRFLLDEYAGHHELVKKVQTLYQAWRSAQDELAHLQAQSEQRKARQELLTYQTHELAQLNLQADEITALDQEQRQLANAERLLNHAQNVLNLLSEQEDVSILKLLTAVQNQLSPVITIDQQLNTINDLINNAEIQLKEAITELQHYLAKVDLDPERLHQVEERLSALHDIARKHRVAPNELPALQTRLETELKEIEHSDTAITQLQNKIITLRQEYQTAAQALSNSRKSAGKKLAPLIEASMRELNMPGGRFAVEFSPHNDAQPTLNGLEKVEFLVSTNPGQPLQSMAKIVSGGELSRISLAIRVLTAQAETIPTLIFDEVDVGIGGGTAEIVGRLLRQLAAATQVLCVTHLPQVAAQSQHHWQIRKITENDVTKTEVLVLNQTDKIQEIARMLGGVKITQQTLAHAKEMVEKVY